MMFNKIVLRNYVPLKDRGINEIILDNIALFNIVLGRNGYGKSSILKQVNLLPPDNSDFYEGGYKEVEAYLKNKHYRVVSHTGKKSSHYFYVDGENLNKGMTLSVQRELVKQHFGLTNDIKNVLNGIGRADVFSSLTPQRRKQLLMEINPNDTSYLLSLFDKFKTDHTHVKGALKYQRQRLAVELQRQKEIEQTTPEELEIEVAFLDKEIKDALIIHGTLRHLKDPDVEKQSRLFHSLCIKLMTYDKSIIFPLSYYQQMAERKQYSIEREIVYKEVLVRLIHDIENKINDIVPDKTMTFEDYDKKIAELDKKHSDIEEEIKTCQSNIEEEAFFKFDDYTNPHFIRIIDELIEHLNHIELTVDEDITSTLFKKLLEKRTQVNKELTVLKAILNDQQCKLKHYHDSDIINCPNCSADFKLGYGKYDVELLERSVDNNLLKVKQHEELLESITLRIETNESWYYSMKTFMSFVSHSQCSHYLLEMVKHFNIGRQHTYRLTTLLTAIKRYNNLVSELTVVEQDKNVIHAQFKLMYQSDIKSLYEKLDELTVSLGGCQNYMLKLKEELADCNEKIEIINADRLARDFAAAQYRVLLEMLAHKGMYRVKEAIEKRINTLTPKKEKLLVNLIKSKSFNNQLKDIANEVEKLDKKEKHLHYLVETLSPTKGFIGNIMFDFLNTVCANVNAILEEVWTDPLRLLSPELVVEESDGKLDLDYKFRVVTTNVEKPVPDIKHCSGGEQEIIDFSLRYVLLKYLGNFPLFMDEVGVAFDELHRARFSHYLSTQARLGKLPQTFMISHYISQYGVFDDEQVNIISLNMDGLKKPYSANKNVTIG